MAQTESRDELRDLKLRRMQGWATGLLVLVTLVYATASSFEPRYPALLYVTAATEAAMVGAIADWFAVVALFHHPLGLQFIPHTAIVPRNKERIAQGIADFIQHNFLSAEAIVARIAQYRPAEKLCAWLLKVENAEWLAGYATRLTAYALGALDDERIRRFLLEAVTAKLRQADVAAAVGEVLDVFTQNGRHHALFDEALASVDELLSRAETRRYLAAEIAKNVPLLKAISDVLRLDLDEKAALKLIDIAIRKISEVRQDQVHELRRRFDLFVADFVRKLKEDEATRAKVHAMRDDFLSNPALAEYIGGLWSDFRSWLSADLQSRESIAHRRIVALLGSAGQTLSDDAEVQQWLDEQILTALPAVVAEHRAKIGRFIEDQINGWQEKKLVLELEREIGPDLQYIRINGTVVGGMAGLLISTITHLAR